MLNSPKASKNFDGGGGAGAEEGGAKAKPNYAPVMDPRISMGEGGISSSDSCANT